LRVSRYEPSCLFRRKYFIFRLGVETVEFLSFLSTKREKSQLDGKHSYVLAWAVSLRDVLQVLIFETGQAKTN